MAIYLITYDLNKENKRPPIVSKVKEIANGWAKLSESSYAIRSESTPTQIYQLLEPLLDGNDTLYVITLNAPFWGQGSEEVNNWLISSLTT